MFTHQMLTGSSLPLHSGDTPTLALRCIGAEFGAKPVPGPMQARLHASERDAGKSGDLLVAESLEVGEIDNQPVPVREGPQRRREIGAQQAPDHQVFGRAIV
jgi:hypothetical protein